VPVSSPQTRAQQLAADIAASIEQRKLEAGDSLGTIDEWRDQSGYARATVSEAVRILIDRGLVRIKPGRGGGLFVASTGPVVRLRHTLLTVHGEASVVADAIAIRDALEPLVIADATRSRSRSDITSLKALLAGLENSVGDRTEFMLANFALHERIADITSNRMLAGIYRSMTETIRENSLLATADSAEQDDPEYTAMRYEVHAELVAAIISGDLEAAAAAVERHAQ
jgi:GntR family transcriptional repressor for pyruvate dehydrogenase complex